jgi:phytoene desaturase (3,4-didehydrolycopene-forming)
LGTSLEAEGIELVKCDPNYRVVFPDKEVVEMSSDLTKMKKTIEHWEGEKGFEGCVFPSSLSLLPSLNRSHSHSFLGFLQEGHAHHELSVDHVLHRNFTSIFSMLRPSLIVNLRQLHIFESVVRLLGR